jgi:hypothetical protein
VSDIYEGFLIIYLRTFPVHLLHYLLFSSKQDNVKLLPVVHLLASPLMIPLFLLAI